MCGCVGATWVHGRGCDRADERQAAGAGAGYLRTGKLWRSVKVLYHPAHACQVQPVTVGRRPARPRASRRRSQPTTVPKGERTRRTRTPQEENADADSQIHQSLPGWVARTNRRGRGTSLRMICNQLCRQRSTHSLAHRNATCHRSACRQCDPELCPSHGARRAGLLGCQWTAPAFNTCVTAKHLHPGSTHGLSRSRRWLPSARARCRA